MSFLLIAESGAVVGINGGHITVTYKNKDTDEIPKETVEGISVFGQSQLTTALVRHCLENNIRVSYFSESGHFYGVLSPTSNANAERMRKQAYLSSDDSFCLNMSKRFIEAKINNQIVILRRFIKAYGYKNIDLSDITRIKKKVELANSLNELGGYEGITARYYFEYISELFSKDLGFKTRNRHPALDPINAMLNLGYSVLQSEICGEIENRGLCSYIGFMHQDKESHAALASDLIEEWRPVLVDSTILDMIHNDEIFNDDFVKEDNACIMKQEAIKRYLTKLQEKMFQESKYLADIGKPISYRMAIWHQAEKLAKAVDTGSSEIYAPIKIR